MDRERAGPLLPRWFWFYSSNLQTLTQGSNSVLDLRGILVLDKAAHYPNTQKGMKWVGDGANALISIFLCWLQDLLHPSRHWGSPK